MCANYRFLVCESMLNIIANDNRSLSINQQFIHSSATVSRNRKRERDNERKRARKEAFGDDHKYL